MKKSRFFYPTIAFSLLVLLANVYGLILLRQRSGLPRNIRMENIVQIDDFEIKQKEDIEFVLSRRASGEPISLVYWSDRELKRIRVNLVPYYSQGPFPYLYFFIGLFSITVGTWVFVVKPNETKARIFFWTSAAFCTAIVINGGFFCLQKNWLSYLPGGLFYLAYPLTPALLLHFSLSLFRKVKKLEIGLIYCSALLFSGVLEFFFFSSALYSSLDLFRIYLKAIYVFRFYVIIFLLISLFHLMLGYRRCRFDEQKDQIRWVLYGLVVGLGPFIALYQLPRILRINPLFSEEFSSLFFVFIPLAFAFSIIKFQFMSIELIINRSLVYSLLTIFTVGLYLFFMQIFHGLSTKIFITQTQKTLASAVAALLVAIAFHPLQGKIQGAVDKTFFRQSYDYRIALLGYIEKAHKIPNREGLIRLLFEETKKVLPLEYLGFYMDFPMEKRRPFIMESGGSRDIVSLVPPMRATQKLLANKNAAWTTENIDFSHEDVMKEKNIDILIPLSFRLMPWKGFLAVGKKSSRERFSRDDLKLLTSLSDEVTFNIERIGLQQEVIYEKAEKEKLNELNKQKTEFISSVSHELRTPMSSIQGLTEMLQEGKIKDRVKRDDLLSLMAGECQRLSRFLRNILDFGKIEQQSKTYQFQKEDIRSIIRETLGLLESQLRSGKFVVKTKLPKKSLRLCIDRDAVRQALTNLIDNAIKYSSKKKEIDIDLVTSQNLIEIQVKDKGIGLSGEDQEKIFNSFFRSEAAVEINPGGVGLGLKIVKHIMDAHKGSIRMKSAPNKGSVFTLVFPKS